eukprot:4316883-Amphidinium_carterae.3
MDGAALARLAGQACPHHFLPGPHRAGQLNPGSGRPSKHLRAIARMFMTALHMPEGATDAGANSTSAAIGGWWASTPGAPKDKVRLFAQPITFKLHPWAWVTGNPQHKIAALELCANLSGVTPYGQRRIGWLPCCMAHPINHGQPSECIWSPSLVP